MIQNLIEMMSDQEKKEETNMLAIKANTSLSPLFSLMFFQLSRILIPTKKQMIRAIGSVKAVNPQVSFWNLILMDRGVQNTSNTSSLLSSVGILFFRYEVNRCS